MIVIVASDFHLGLSRKANFTSESSSRRERRAREVLRQLYDSEADGFICCGDFFDCSSNDEGTILDALEFASYRPDKPLVILAGNHDLLQDAEKKSSFHVVSEIVSRQNYAFMLLEPTIIRLGPCALYFLPHCLSQDLFLAALDAAEAEIKSQAMPRVLFLHCSYDLGFETSNTALNLTRERAATLLQTFDRIFIGHEHTERTDFDGRLILVGSHYPTAFDNLTDKVHYRLNLGTLGATRCVHWEANKHVYRGPADQAAAGYEFYDLEGEVDPKIPVRLFKEGALGVRTPARNSSQTTEEKLAVAMERLPDLIAKELSAEPEKLALWLELSEPGRA